MSAASVAQTTKPLDTKADIVDSIRLSDGVELLDTIDKLRALGIDKEIPLPQIVVVGQQSSGKSSVLEAISGIPFPTTDELCTICATEVVLRRAPAASTSVRIVRQSYAVFGPDPYQERIDEFHRDVEAMATFGVDKVPEIVAMAKECLSPGSSENISKDLLRIEVTGPDQDHLTLVDLPGLFYYPKPGQNADAPKIVKDLATKYMSEKRSIILAVLSARTEYCAQEILQTLKGIDPSGSRTMGIITGLDQIERFSKREAEFLALVENDTAPLALGWHALRNPSFSERKTLGLDRQALETNFFETQQPWSAIDHNCRGAKQLRMKLSHVLMEHIGRELNAVVAALDQKIEDCASSLEKCGVERTTPQQRRTYLAKIGTEYRTLVKAALEGPYEDSFFASTGWRLRAKVRKRSEDFASDMNLNGHKWDIESAGDATDVHLVSARATRTKKIGERFSADEGEQFPHFILVNDYVLKVDEVLQQHRGRELQGTFDPLLVGLLFRDQSCRWRSLAEEFSRQIADMVSKFVLRLVEHLTNSRRTCGLLTEHLRLALRVREHEMQARLCTILKPFERSFPITYNLESLEDSFDETISSPVDSDDDCSQKLVEIDRRACQQLTNAMQTYYDIALCTFVDNVATLGIELCLLDGLEDLFSAVTVAGMSDEDVNKLASESPEDMLHRRTTEKRLEKLKAGREVCQRYSLPDLQADNPAIVVDQNVDQLVKAFDTFKVSRPTTPVCQSVQQTNGESLALSPNTSRSTSSKSRKSVSTRATTPEAAVEQVTVPSPLAKKSAPSLVTSRPRKKSAAPRSESDSDL